MAYRVIQWATGNVGKSAIEGVLAHPELELVGCWVHSEAKDGVDVGEICGIGPVAVAATTDRDAILAMDADCVVYSPMLANPRDVVALLESGKNVVTPVGWVYPWHTPHADKMQAAAERGGVTLHGSGIHPGGMTERFPLVFTSMCTNIRHVRSDEYSDIRSYATPFVVREVMLFGKDPDVARESPMARLLGEGFFQSIDMVADVLGVELDAERRTTHEIAVATAPIETPVGVLEPGTVAGQRFIWQGTVAGEPVVTATVNWLMGDQHLDPAWSFGAEGPRYELTVEADNPLHITIHGTHPVTPEAGLVRNPGIVATAMHCVNAVPYVVEAAPGIKTYLDLPLIAGRYGTGA